MEGMHRSQTCPPALNEFQILPETHSFSNVVKTLEELLGRLINIEEYFHTPSEEPPKPQALYEEVNSQAYIGEMLNEALGRVISLELLTGSTQANLQVEVLDLRAKLDQAVGRLNTSLEEAQRFENENIELNNLVCQLKSDGREILQKRNDDLKEEIDGLRATIVGTEFQAWDLGELLKQYSSIREHWVSQFLFLSDAKDGSYLALTVASVFRWTQDFIDSNVKDISAAMYDDNQSETIIQFIKSTLQSNYAKFEVDLRKEITEAAKTDENYKRLKESYKQLADSERDVTYADFDKLFNDIIKTCGMLVLCEPRLNIVTECNMDYPATFDIRITTAEVTTVCFPGLILKEGSEYHWKEKVCIATSEDF